jgi:hypothetical protein
MGTSNLIANNTIYGTGNGLLSMNDPTAGILVSAGGSNVITGNYLEKRASLL